MKQERKIQICVWKREILLVLVVTIVEIVVMGTYWVLPWAKHYVNALHTLSINLIIEYLGK